MARFVAKPNSSPEIKDLKNQNLAESSSYVNPIKINDSTVIDNSLTSFLKLKGNSTSYAQRYLTIRQQLETYQGGGENPEIKKEIEELVQNLTQSQYIQMFFDSYMAPGGESSDIVLRLGKPIAKADISNTPYIGNNKNNRTYTPINMELNFNLKGNGFTGGTVKYYNNLFPPYSNANFKVSEDNSSYSEKKTDKWIWDNNGETFVLAEGATEEEEKTKFDSSTLTSIRNLTFRGLAYKGINDNISLLQKILEGATGIVSTYLTEWDISLYCQEKILDKNSIPCLTMNIKNDNPSGYTDSAAYCYGQLNSAVSKLSDTDVAINSKSWEPWRYPLSCYWTSYGSGKDGNNKDLILHTAAHGLTNGGLLEYGFTQDKFSNLGFNEKVKFFDYQQAAYSGWTSFKDLKNYQAIYTTDADNESGIDMIHLQTQTKEFGWNPNGKFESMPSVLEDFHLMNEKEPNYGENVDAYEEQDFTYMGKETDGKNKGLHKWYKAYYVSDENGKPTTAFGKMSYRNDNGTILREEWVANMWGAKASISTINSATLLQAVRYGDRISSNLANGWNSFIKNCFDTDENGVFIPAWNDGAKKLFIQNGAFGWGKIFQNLFDDLSGTFTKYENIAPGSGWLTGLVMPKKRDFAMKSNSTPSTSSYKQQASSANSSSIVVGNSENIKNAPQNGVSQLAPALHGGPHGKFSSPNSLQAYFEPSNEALRNVPRISHKGFIDSDNNFIYKNGKFDDYNQESNVFYGSSAGVRSPACAFNMLKDGFFEPANYKVKVLDDFPITIPYIAKTKTVSKSEYDTLKSKHPSLEGRSKNYGKEYKITYYVPSTKKGGSLDNEVKFSTAAPDEVYGKDELAVLAKKADPTNTHIFSSDTCPNSKEQCLEMKDEHFTQYTGGPFEYDNFIRYATEEKYFVRSSKLSTGVTPTSYNGYISRGYELLAYNEKPVAEGTVLDEREETYKEPLIMSDFENAWQISKIFTYDIVENSWWSNFADNFVRFFTGKARVKGPSYKEGDKKEHYVLQIKGARKDTSDYTEEVKDEDDNKITRTKAFSTDLYCTDKEMQFRRMIFGDNKNMWKHPLFFVSKENDNPSLDNTCTIVQLPCKISTYDYIQQDVNSGSCGRKTVSMQKKQGTFIEVDLEYNMDKDWLTGHDPLKFNGLDITKTPFTAKSSESWNSISKGVDEILPDDTQNIEAFFEIEDTFKATTEQTKTLSPCGPALVAGLKGDDIEDIQNQKWFAGVGYTTYLPGLKPDVSSIKSDTIKKIVSLDELAPFTVETTYEDTKTYFNTHLPDCKKYHIEEPKARKGFTKEITHKLIRVEDEKIRDTRFDERKEVLYEALPILYVLDQNKKVYFNETVVEKLSSLKDLYVAEDTVNSVEAGTTCKNKIDDCIKKIKGQSGYIEDTLFTKTYKVISNLYKKIYIYDPTLVTSKKAKFISYDNSQTEQQIYSATLSTEYARFFTFSILPTALKYVDEIEEKAVLKIEATLFNGEKIIEECKQYEYSYDSNFQHTPIDIYVCNLEKNAFVYENGEYESEEQGIPSKRTFVEELYYSDKACTKPILGTTKIKANLTAEHEFNASQVTANAETTAQIRKELAKSVYYSKFGEIFVDDYTASRPKTTSKEGGYSFPNRSSPSWNYQYAAYCIFAPKNAKEIVDGNLSLDATEFKPADVNIHKKLNTLFFQAFCAPAFMKSYEEASDGHIPVDSITGFNVLFKTLAIQSNWIGIAKKFYVDLLNYDSAKMIIENGVGKDILEHTLPQLVDKDNLTDEDKNNVKYRYWISKAWDIFSSTKEVQGQCFIEAKSKLDALLKDRYGQLANRGSIKDITPKELENMFTWVKKCFEFLNDPDYQQMGEYMMSYLNVLYELRKYYVNMRCNKINGTLWNIRHIESSIPLVKDTLQVDSSGIDKIEDSAGQKPNGYNVVAKEVTNTSSQLLNAIINEKKLFKNQITHIFTKVEYVDDYVGLKKFITKINDPEFKVENLKPEDEILVFLPHNAQFAKLPFSDFYTLTSGDYYAEKAKSLTNKPLKDSFRKPKDDGSLSSDFLEFSWDIKWKYTGFDTIETILSSERYNKKKEAILSKVSNEFKEIENLSKLKVFYYDNSSDDIDEVRTGQTDPATPIIVWGIAESVNLKNLLGAAKALEDDAVDATSFYCATGAKADYWRILVPAGARLPLVDDFNDNCMIEALNNVNQAIDYDETLTTILGPFAYSAYPIDEQQENSQILDVMESMGLSGFKPKE